MEHRTDGPWQVTILRDMEHLAGAVQSVGYENGIGEFIEGKRIGYSPTSSVMGGWNDHLSQSCVRQQS